VFLLLERSICVFRPIEYCIAEMTTQIEEVVDVIMIYFAFDNLFDGLRTVKYMLTKAIVKITKWFQL
jgi:hypothetical protein